MRTDSLHGRVASAHPWLLTLAFCVSWGLMYAVAFVAPAAWRSPALLTLPIGVMCLWYWTLYRTAQEGRPLHARTLPAWTFAIPPAIGLVAGLAGWSMDNSPAAFAFFAALGVLLWFTARAIESADIARGPASVWRSVGTMLLLYFALLGVWVLAPRVRRILAQPAT